MMMTQLFFIETSKTISVSETRKKDLSNGVGPICLSQLVKKWQKCKDLQPSGKKKSLHKWLWGVPNWPPGEKSIWCRKFGDGVESGGRVGTLRWTPEVPQCLVRRLIGGLTGVKMAKNGKMVIFQKKIQNSLIFSVCNAVHGLVGLRKHESTKWGHRWWGVNHRGA